MKYWVTHPGLTPAHDHQIEAGALAGAVRSGWRIRDDQTDPVEVVEAADPRPAIEIAPDPADVADPVDDTHDEPASTPEPGTTTKKGEV